METKGFYSPREQESIGNWKDNAIVWLNKVFNLPGVDSISQLLENCLILGFIARKLNTCGNQFEIDETCLLTEKDILSQRPLTTMVQDMSAFHKIQAKYVDEANRLSLSDLQLLANDALATKAAVCLSQIATNASKHIQGIPEFPQHPSAANLTTQHEESHHEKELKLEEEEDEEDDDDTCSYKDAYQSVGSDYNYDSCSSSPTIKHSARSNNSYKYDPVITPSTKLSNEARISFIDNTAFSPATTTTAVPSCNQLINNNNPPDYDYYQYNPSEGEDMMKIPAMRRRENKHNTPISTTVDVRKDEMDMNIGNASNTTGSAMMMIGDPLESILSPEKMKPKHSQLLNSIMHAGCYDEAKQLFSSSSSNNNNNKVGERRSNGGGYVKCHTPEKCREEGSGGGIEGKRGAWWQKAGLMVLGAAAGLVIAALNGGVRKGRRDDGKKKVVVRKHGWDSPLVVSRG
jgi:hypothetical protein